MGRVADFALILVAPINECACGTGPADDGALFAGSEAVFVGLHLGESVAGHRTGVLTYHGSLQVFIG